MVDVADITEGEVGVRYDAACASARLVSADVRGVASSLANAFAGDGAVEDAIGALLAALSGARRGGAGGAGGVGGARRGSAGGGRAAERFHRVSSAAEQLVRLQSAMVEVGGGGAGGSGRSVASDHELARAARWSDGSHQQQALSLLNSLNM
jgi:hypothetical protein